MARLYKKTRGSEAKLAYQGHVLTENRNGLVVDARLTQASGTAERDAALAMLANKPAWKRVTLGGDRGYDTRGFVAALRELNVTPHVARNDTNRSSAIRTDPSSRNPQRIVRTCQRRNHQIASQPTALSRRPEPNRLTRPKISDGSEGARGLE